MLASKATASLLTWVRFKLLFLNEVSGGDCITSAVFNKAKISSGLGEYEVMPDLILCHVFSVNIRVTCSKINTRQQDRINY